MSLQIKVKIGTHSLSAYYLKSKRKYPNVGDRVFIKSMFDAGEKWRLVQITEKIYPEAPDHFKADLI